MGINEITLISHGVGGSYTKWQGEPPRHAVYWVETDEGQTSLTAYDTRKKPNDKDVTIEEESTGPNDTQFKSEVDFPDLPEPTKQEIREHIIKDFEKSAFFED